MMRVLFFSYLFLLFVSVLRFLPDAQAANTGYYAAPNGSSSSCTRQSPCSLQTALDRAGSSNEIVLKDGTYYSTLFTKRHGVTIRAENTRKAVIKPPRSGWRSGKIDSSQGDGAYVRIHHANTTVSGIVFDGDGRRSFMIAWIRGANNVVFENNVLRNSVASLFHGGDSKNVIFRHNLLEDSGAEAMYMGASKTDPMKLNGAQWNENWQLYGNIFRDIGEVKFHNDIDMKNNNRNMDIHHNIMEGSPKGADGCFQVNGYHHKIHDNIFRNTNCGTAVFDSVGRWAGLTITDNVISSVKSRAAVWHEATYRSGNGLEETKINDNTFCSASTKVCQRNGSCGGAPSGISMTGNSMNASQSTCNAEVNRILGEMKNLPGVSDKTAQRQQELQPPVLRFDHF